ncbi:unnamed protein product, partial [Ectocarpus sp. 12 AP-2014]
LTYSNCPIRFFHCSSSRYTAATTNTSLLLVEINRDLPSTRKSNRHVHLQVEKCHNINGGQYSLAGIARHHGRGRNSGHWTTLAKDDDTWFKYERNTKVKVAIERVSSNEAVHLVFRRVG